MGGIGIVLEGIAWVAPGGAFRAAPPLGGGGGAGGTRGGGGGALGGRFGSVMIELPLLLHFFVYRSLGSRNPYSTFVTETDGNQLQDLPFTIKP